MKRHVFAEEILKECDIRGIAGSDLTDKDAYFVGRAFGTHLKRCGGSSCIVGYDGRLSSSSLSLEVERGLSESGVDVVSAGLVPTPVIYFAVGTLRLDGGIVVTASHNPPEYNGFKFAMAGRPFSPEDLRNLSDISRKSDFTSGKGRRSSMDILPGYIEYLEGFIRRYSIKDFRIVWDPGNGAAAVTLPLLLERLPGSHRIICGWVDGTFPNHHPDPSVEENVKLLQRTVIETGADFGIAFDGDGDRIGVVDSEGYLLKGDQLLAVYARHFLSRNPGATVMSEVKASRLLYDDIIKNGGRPFMWKVGHVNQKKKMIECGIMLAGETSGHFFFKENSGYDDAMFAAVKLIAILSESASGITEIRKGFPEYHDTGEIRIPADKEKRSMVVSEISRRLVEAGRSFCAIDGIRTEYLDGFWTVRESNTMPHLTVRCAAASLKGFSGCLSDLDKHLSASGMPGKMIPASGVSDNDQ